MSQLFPSYGLLSLASFHLSNAFRPSFIAIFNSTIALEVG